ncbi:MAG: diguanylate cyclase [Anaerolineales bacterium]|nr:diguanylate cyclase [Anaerolineales bacterium]MDW8446287.1 diguanylate cyclase [Anaerolineales bacterium]
MVATSGWILSIIGQGIVFVLLIRFLRHSQRRGAWWALTALPLLMIVFCAYQVFQSGNSQPVAAFFIAAASMLCAVLLWLLLPSVQEALTQYERTRLEHEELRLVFEHLPNPIVIKDLDLRYRMANPAFAQSIGKAVEGLIGHSDAAFFPPRIAQVLEEGGKSAVATKSPAVRKLELTTVKGQRWFEVTLIPLLDRVANARGILVHAQDLTETVRTCALLEDQLRSARLLLLALQRMLACRGEEELWDISTEIIEEIGGTPYVVLLMALDEPESFLVKSARKADCFKIGERVRLSGFFGGDDSRDKLQVGEADAGWKGIFRNGTGQGLDLVVSVAIFKEDHIEGVIALFYERSEGEKIERGKEILADLAKFIGIKLSELSNRAQIQSQLSQVREELERHALHQRLERFLVALATRLVNASPHQIQGLLERAIGSFAEYLNAQRSYVYLFKEGGGLVAQYRWAEAGKLLPPSEIPEPYDEAMSWLVERLNRQEVVVLSRSGEMSGPFRVYLEAQDIDSWVAVPMVSQRTVVGYFGLEGKAETHRLIYDQMSLLKSMAEIVVVALERKRNAEELEKQLRVLSEKMTHLEWRNQRNKLLAEMGDLLQSCRTADEAFPIVSRYAQALLPQSAGSLYLLRSVRDMAEKVASWGSEASGANELALNECWGIRRGKIHVVHNASGPLCDHLGSSIPERYVCVPLIAQGETIGLLHLRYGESGEQSGLEEMRQTAMALADHVAPALSNLNLRDKLRSQAIRDPLTGLYNRRYMEETLEREIRRAARHQYSVGLIMCDIDQMKPINDRFGHDAGDVVLRHIGSLMKKIFRGEDVACRYGGDEFMIILPEASLSDVWQRAENLREMVKRARFEYEGKLIGPVTLSIGVAAYPDLGFTVERLVQASDAAAYLAKREGGDRVMIARQAEDNNQQG